MAYRGSKDRDMGEWNDGYPLETAHPGPPSYPMTHSYSNPQLQSPGQLPGQMIMQGQGQYGYPQGPVLMQQPQPMTVVIQQGGQQVTPSKRQWKSGLCGCCSDMGVCCAVYWLGNWECCYLAYLSSRMGESCCVGCCVPFALITMRTAMRERYNIQGSICDDCMASLCCMHCVMCQLQIEMSNVGL
ncbi:placenta-specific gene 8 protein [Lingula anatina]|uniref:Placenta-specific gene 8 protein n=1 Tax=Lingula anatina TaxID=7574 RepID=A0A1S3IRF5_LINAN|nr:placenta-specific gene 8 protein [Lingula anatina]|eukprot:XP_013400653.1 placenta-specific gene 8 protein [Lingula anatina]